MYLVYFTLRLCTFPPIYTFKKSSKGRSRDWHLSILISFNFWATWKRKKVKIAQLCPTLCNPMDFYSPWNSPSQNTGVGSLFPSLGHLPLFRGSSFLQGIFPTQGSNPGLPHCSRFFTVRATREAGVDSLLVSRGFPGPGINLGSPKWQVDSLPAKLSNVYKVFLKSTVLSGCWLSRNVDIFK